MPAPADVMPALADTPEEAPASQEPVDLQAPEDSTAAERQRLDPVVESDLSGMLCHTQSQAEDPAQLDKKDWAILSVHEGLYQER
ncbi:UNVERIFIED_CONTAM: hypothetical protein K2H54_015093 [Gekko kuhli]